MTKSAKPKKKKQKMKENLDHLTRSIGEAAKSIQALARRAEAQYSVEVKDIIESGDRDPKRIECLLDLILDFCFDKKVLMLYKKLCRYYFFIDPTVTASYIQAYREMWDEESLKVSALGTPSFLG